MCIRDRSPGLEVVHDELAGLERLAAMRARYPHEDDAVPGRELSHPMDDERIEDVPAALRFAADLRERIRRHARVMLEPHRGNGMAVVGPAHQSDEARHRAHV